MERRSRSAIEPLRVRIRIGVQLDAGWSAWFEGLAVHPLDSGETWLSGTVTDQASLHGLLARIRDLGVPLVSLEVTGTAGDALATERASSQLREDGAAPVGRPPIDNGR